MVQVEMEGCKVGKKFCGSMRCDHFTNVSQNFCLWRVQCEIVKNRSHQNK